MAWGDTHGTVSSNPLVFDALELPLKRGLDHGLHGTLGHPRAPAPKPRMCFATRKSYALTYSFAVTSETSSNMYFWILVSSEFYVLSLAGYKSALVLLYLQLFGPFGVNRVFRYVCYVVLFYTCGYLFCNLIVEVGGCQPIQKFWLYKTPGHCTNSVAQNIAFGAMHMTSDLAIAILPLPMVWRLQLRSNKEKWGLAAVLGSGIM